MPTYSDLNGVLGDSFRVAQATVDASDLTAARTFTLPDATGTVALTSDIAGGTRFIDGGNASSVYTPEQIIDGGDSSNF